MATTPPQPHQSVWSTLMGNEPAPTNPPRRHRTAWIAAGAVGLVVSIVVIATAVGAWTGSPHPTGREVAFEKARSTYEIPWKTDNLYEFIDMVCDGTGNGSALLSSVFRVADDSGLSTTTTNDAASVVSIAIVYGCPEDHGTRTIETAEQYLAGIKSAS